jgi:hypothetical protein
VAHHHPERSQDRASDPVPGTVPDPGIDPTSLKAPPGHPKILTQRSAALLAELRDHDRASGSLSPLTYNITVSHPHRFLWFRNAKVGTRTILGFLDDQQVDDRLLVLSLTQYPTAAFADYFKFGFVRHPLDRFISAWQDKVHQQNHFRFGPAKWERMKTIENFAAWVAKQDLRDLATTDRHVALQSRLIDLTQVDYLGRMETFGSDFSAVCSTIGLEWTEPVRQNQSQPRGVSRDNASAELRSMVEEMYARDYQVFGY